MINRDTKLYISVAKNPGNFGATVYNALFHKYNLNCLYLPRQANDPKSTIEAIRTLNVQGCSVTSPLKSSIIPYLDKIDEQAQNVNSVNTIVKIDAHTLKGFNTDLYGFENALHKQPLQSALVYGSGSVVNTVVQVLNKLSVKSIQLTARDEAKAESKAQELSIKHIQNSDLKNTNFDILINCTPASLESNHEILSLASHANIVFDLLVSMTDTKLIETAKKLNKKTIVGLTMAKYQLIQQFKLYTGLQITSEEVDAVLKILK